MFPVSFRRNGSREAIADGSFIVVSEHLINSLTKEARSATLTIQQCKDKVQHKTSRSYSMLQTYKMFFTEPAQLETCSLDDLVGISKNFHLLQPLLDKSCIKTVYQMLTLANLDLISLDDLLLRGAKNCLVRCNCVTYMHYAWCQHSCAFAFKFNIIKDYPSRKDPRRLPGHGKNGRPTSAKRGGALTFD
jgi:hypothetical protein